MPKHSSSMKKTALSAVEQYELNQWLEQNQISSTNLRRSFTDVLPLARLLSRYYPELIDLNYYPPRNSVQNKLCNWESFNKRVLARLGVQLTREQMVRVARSVPGSVDLLLYSVMRVQVAAERKAREERPSSEDEDESAPTLQDDLKAETEPEAEPETKHKIKPKDLTFNVGVAETKDTATKSLKQAPLKRAAAHTRSSTVVARGGGGGVSGTDSGGGGGGVGGGGGGGAAAPRAGRNKKQPLTAELIGSGTNTASNVRQRGRQSAAAKKR